jgi:lipopolysaccharide/colanic/teichoic acid biosynthesis glycosyltransferase
MYLHVGDRQAPRVVRISSSGAALSRMAKRSLDIVVSTTALLLLSPLMLVVAATVRLTSPGPALFRQTRAGLHAEPFLMFKFRTMRAGCSDEVHRQYVARLLASEAVSVDGLYKLDHDARITRVGSFLRRWSLDELPQLLNVLRGDMSLVGPRPALPWELEMLPNSAQARFEVPPGLTGLWQVSGRNQLTMLEGLELDIQYAAHPRMWQDLKILVRTVPALIRPGAR